MSEDPIAAARRQTAVEAYEAHMRTVNHMQAPPMPRYQFFTHLEYGGERQTYGGLTSDQAGEIEKLKPPPAPATKPPNEALARAIGAKKP